MKYFVTLLFTLLFTQALASPLSSSNDEHITINFESNLQQHIQQWITTLAAEDDFASWSNVIWETHPLGPGTHSWLVLIYSAISLEERGYLVIGATPQGGLELVEYGLGDYPLFSLTTLNRALNELAPTQKDKLAEASQHLYFHPLQAVWQVSDIASPNGETSYFDAVTAELYHLNDEMFALFDMEHDVALISPTSQLAAAATSPSFDPYDQINWLFDDPMQPDDDELIEELIEALHLSQHITYVASVFTSEIHIPLAVIGYHLWDDGIPYIKLDQYSSRFIPLAALLQCGDFYIN